MASLSHKTRDGTLTAGLEMTLKNNDETCEVPLASFIV